MPTTELAAKGELKSWRQFLYQAAHVKSINLKCPSNDLFAKAFRKPYRIGRRAIKMCSSKKQQQMRAFVSSNFEGQ